MSHPDTDRFVVFGGWRQLTPHLTARVYATNSISIASSVFAERTCVTSRQIVIQTHRPHYSISIVALSRRIYACDAALKFAVAKNVKLTLDTRPTGWLGSRVVSVLDSQKARVQIAAATLSGNSLRQTVHIHLRN